MRQSTEGASTTWRIALPIVGVEPAQRVVPAAWPATSSPPEGATATALQRAFDRLPSRRRIELRRADRQRHGAAAVLAVPVDDAAAWAAVRAGRLRAVSVVGRDVPPRRTPAGTLAFALAAWQEAEHPREPAGTPDGGQFADKPGAPDISDAPDDGLFVALVAGATKVAKPVRRALRVIVQRARRVGWEVLFPQGIVLGTLYEFFTPGKPNGGEEEILQMLRAAREFPKTQEEMRARPTQPGEPGYQQHHNLERTKENRSLPPGFRELPENKGYVSTLDHETIHSEMSKKNLALGDLSPRDYLRGSSQEEQLDYMKRLMKLLGILK